MYRAVLSESFAMISDSINDYRGLICETPERSSTLITSVASEKGGAWLSPDTSAKLEPGADADIGKITIDESILAKPEP